VLHEAEEERQVGRIDALLVEGEDELAPGRGQQVVGILDAFAIP